MRRLIVWTVLLLCLASLSLVAVRRSEAAACVQLLDPVTGSVLTVDVNTEHAMLDARTTYPVPTIVKEFDPFDDQEVIYDPLSPDKNHIVDIWPRPQSPLFDLDLGPRSAVQRRRLNASGGAIQFGWSPDSTHIAFTDIAYQGNLPHVYLVVADTNGRTLHREVLPAEYYDSYADYVYRPVWSPDGTIVTLQFMISDHDTLLALLPINADHVHYLTFPNETIMLLKWSPTSNRAFILTEDQRSNTHKVHMISRDSTLIENYPTLLDFAPSFKWRGVGLPSGNETYAEFWSPDGQYFYLADTEQVQVFNQRGDRVVTPLLSYIQVRWSALPHTLLYFTLPLKENDYFQTLYALDASTGQFTSLLEPLGYGNLLYPAPDSSAFLIAAHNDQGGIVPHIFAFDLTGNEMPFGELHSRYEIIPQWSPDHQKLLMYSDEPSEFVVWWRIEASGELNHVRVAKQDAPRGETDASWLTNDVIILKDHTKDQQTTLLLDTRSAQLHALPSFPTDKSSRLGHDDAYLAMNTPTGITVYKLSTGQSLLTAQISKEHLIPIFDPQERSLLLIQDDNASYSLQSLYLATTDTIQPISEQSILTHPAWSPDGSSFAFGHYDSTGQYLKVMSRDGTLLKEVSIAAYGYAWHDVRWTRCD